MTDILPEETARFVRAAIPDVDDEVLREMEAHGESHGPPTVGREVGNLLHLLTGLVGATRVFEFGSGYGYSGYWYATALPEDGEIVLTDFDADELDRARDYFERAGIADRAAFAVGDALNVVERYDGPFDVVLIDHAKESYPEAFEAVREKVAPGGLVVADNAMVAGPLEFDGILALLEGDDPGDVNEQTRGVAEYLLRVRADPTFETSVVPLGEGISVSRKIPK